MFSALQSAAQGLAPVSRRDIVPLSETQRLQVAAPPGGLRSDVPTNGTQHGGMTQSPVLQPPPKSSNVALILAAAGVMAAIGLAGIGAAVMAKKQAAAARPPATATAAPTGVLVEPTTTTPVAPRERTVTLLIAPPNATVEIDGQKREATNGAVEITGAPGAVVAVRLTANGAETTQNVAITEGGAIPPKLTVTPLAIATTATPTTTTTARPGVRPNAGTAPVRPVPSAPGTALNAQRNFE
jgi:hypothetical protein